MTSLTVRDATPDDSERVAAVYGAAFSGLAYRPHESDEASRAGGFELMLQTGSAFLVAFADDDLFGAVRWWQDEGICWYDLLASLRPGTGRALTRAVDQRAQDLGLRLVRTRIPDVRRMADAFGRWGYLPVSRVRGETFDTLELEKRVPLLTVREQRRSDAAAMAALANLDPWPFEQGSRPGWFVLADGDRVSGVVSVRDLKGGAAEIATPVLASGYEGRGLDVWMLERAATWASTNGYHTISTLATDNFRRRERDLEDRRWFRDGERFVKQAENRPLDEERGMGFDFDD